MMSLSNHTTTTNKRARYSLEAGRPVRSSQSQHAPTTTRAPNIFEDENGVEIEVVEPPTGLEIVVVEPPAHLLLAYAATGGRPPVAMEDAEDPTRGLQLLISSGESEHCYTANLSPGNASNVSGSSNQSWSSTNSLSCDERRAAAALVDLGISLPQDMIVNMDIELLNQWLSEHPELSEEQVAKIREIRRRGKNKIAAQNCRKRKQDTIESLQCELLDLYDRQVHLEMFYQQLVALRDAAAEQVDKLDAFIRDTEESTASAPTT